MLLASKIWHVINSELAMWKAMKTVTLLYKTLLQSVMAWSMANNDSLKHEANINTHRLVMFVLRMRGKLANMKELLCNYNWCTFLSKLNFLLKHFPVVFDFCKGSNTYNTRDSNRHYLALSVNFKDTIAFMH